MSDKNKESAISVLKFEGDADTLVWKHPTEDFAYGSQLIVHENQEAVFFRDGQALDVFGPGRHTLETQKLPLLGKAYKLPAEGDSVFHSEVYFINLSTVMGVKWGTDSKVRVFDPMSGLHLELGASGEFNIRIVNSKKLLIKLVGTTSSLDQSQLLGIGDGKGYFRGMIMTQVKSYIAQAIKEENINILEIDARLNDLSSNLRTKLNEWLKEYGLEIPEFFVSSIVTPDDDPNYRKLRDQFAEQYLSVRQEQIKQAEAEAAQARKAVEAETEAKLKVIEAQGSGEALKIKSQAEADAYTMKVEAEANEMRVKNFTYQQQTAREVGMEAMKNGLTGGGGASGAVGELAGLGIGLGAMGGVAGITKDIISPVMESAVGGSSSAGWTCSCGQIGNTGNFCSNCGNKKPVENPVPGTWNCSCGATNITGNFCSNCGSPKPVANTWDCSCGQKNITGNFCSNCGKKRGE